MDVTAQEPWPLRINRKNCIAICRQLDGLFVISSQLRKSFIDYGVDSKKIHIINMTVDAERFANVRKDGFKERYIAYCGTASNNKDGIDELIKAFALVVDKVKDVKLYIIGKTPSKIDEINNSLLIEKLNLKEKIVFTGIIPFNEMPKVLKNADALVLARPNSLQAKCGFPTKLGEYLLTGNPVVVTKVGDIPLFLKDGISALLSDDRSPKEFANKIIWALTHSKEAAIIGENGKLVALQYFNNYTETHKIISVFNLPKSID